MIIRASAKFQRQYSDLSLMPDLPAGRIPLTWNLDILAHGRNQLLIIASEDLSLYSLLIPVTRSRNANTFILPFQKRLAQLLPSPQHSVVGVISNRTNRRVIGSQNDLLFIARGHLEDAAKPATPSELQDIEEKLNSAPMAYLDMECPEVAFSRLMKKLTQCENP